MTRQRKRKTKQRKQTTKAKSKEKKRDLGLQIMNVIGIDPSLTATGYAIFIDDKYRESGVIKPDIKKTVEERIEHVRDAIERKINYYKLKTVAIEGYSYGSKGRATFTSGELGGVLRNYFHRNNIEFTVFPPTVIKLFVTGKGNAKKDLMIMKTYKKWGIEFDNSDECDAYCIARCFLESDKK